MLPTKGSVEHEQHLLVLARHIVSHLMDVGEFLRTRCRLEVR